MFKESEILIANKTSRNTGAVGKNAIVPKYVREYVRDYFYNCFSPTILDFGAGKTAAHTQALLDEGYDVIAYEFGKNINLELHNLFALAQQYDIVFASNVLNVQSSLEMARNTIEQFSSVVNSGGVAIANYPAVPRKMDLTVDGMVNLLLERFETVSKVGGTKQAPLWLIEK